jgi:hypothetical protein
MPIYEYRCECGARLESLEKVGAPRAKCAELCTKTGSKSGEGAVERMMSGTMIRGDGREAKEVVIDPCKRSNRPGGGCEGHDEW